MPNVPNLVVALQTFLLANTDVASVVGTNVFAFELALSEDPDMPLSAVVINRHGGPASFHTLQLHDQRVSVFCYGGTPHLADVVYSHVYQALKNLTPSVWANTYIHWANEQSGPIPYRDPDLQWPYNVSTWLVRQSDLEVG